MAEICRRCNAPKREAKAGSITQWIATCDCDLPKLLDDAPAEQSESVKMCLTCGKRIVSKQRAGSFTQWIFRSDLCSCEQPKFARPSDQLPSHAVAGSDSSSVSDVNIIDEVENDDLLPPIQVDPSLFPQERYRPLKLLGKGAAGAVYMCRDSLLQKRVAVKVLHNLSPQQLVSFQQEAKATSRLNHPNIVKVLDFGVSDGSKPYMVMELFAGITLADYLREHDSVNEGAAVPLFEQITHALRYAHEKGVFHRDVKPNNLILTGNSHSGFAVQIIDFGVASIDAESQEVETDLGTTVTGTPNYMSPDQAKGLPYDARSEIYSVGCVMYEAMTGRVPFSGETTMEILSRHANEEPTPPSELCAISNALQRIILRCLEKEPGDRFQDMNALLLALNSIGQSATTDGASGSEGSRKGSFSPLAICLALFFCLSVPLVVIALVSHQMNQKTQEPSRSKKTTELLGVADALQDMKSFDVLDSTGSIAEFTGPSGQPEVRINKTLNDKDIAHIKDLLEKKSIRVLEFNVSDIVAAQLEPFADSHLVALRLKQNVMTNEMFQIIGRMTDLDTLNLNYDTHMTAADFACLKNLKKLRTLTVSNAIFPSDVVDVIGHTLPTIRFLDLSFSKGVNGNISSLSLLKELGTLNLNTTLCDDRLAQVLPKLKKLKYVVLSNNRGITGKTLQSMNGLPIGCLAIDSTSITQKDLAAMKGLTLRSVDVSKLGLTDAAMDYLVTPNLRRINISGNKMSNVALDRLSSVKSLQLVQCTGNPLITETGIQRLSKIAECTVQSQEADIFTMTP